LNQNIRNSIKGSKDSDSSLVSNENFSEILPFSGWAICQITWAKMAKNLPHSWHHSQKTWSPKLFSIADLKSLLRVWTAFEQNWLVSYGVAKWCKI